MSMETYIFTKKEKIPTTAELQEVIKNTGFDYTLAEGFDTSSDEFGFWMGSFEGLESGCDYVVDAYDAEDWEFNAEDSAKVGDADSVVTLGSFSNAQEIVAMTTISSVLTQIMGAVMASDFFSEELIDSTEAVEMAKEIIENSREQFNGPSTTREAVLASNDNFEQKIKEGLSHTDGYESGKDFAFEVRDSLQGAGIVLEDEVDLAFYLYVADKSGAQRAIKQMEILGLACRIDEDSYSTPSWLCYGSKKMLPTVADLENIGDTLLSLASTYDGNFDGWEMVPDYGFDPFASEVNEEQCKVMAKEILSNTQKIHTPPHEYIEAKHTKFINLDLAEYNNRQQEMEALGFELLSDLENKTISNTGQIVTFARVMYHPKSRTIGMFYFFDMMGLFFFEFASELSDSTLIFTTNAIPGDENATPDNIDANYMQFATLEELHQAHQDRVEKCLKNKALSTKELDTVEKFITMENEVVKRKYEKLKSIGWISKEYLSAQSGGDEELAECIYEALQKILE